jgi:hemerythrin-like domain-containing protein
MKAFLDVLMREHRDFHSMLGVLETVASRMERGDPLPPAMPTDLVDFFERFADRHHSKEEVALFPEVARHGLGHDKSVVAALLAQHEAGRAYTRKMRADLAALQGGAPDAATDFANHARGYAELMREHIRIEDAYFYRLADELLTREEGESLRAMFSPGRHDDGLPAAERERYVRMLSEYPALAAAWVTGAARMM